MGILMVEDEFLVAAEIRFHLERGGFRDVEHAATEAAALAAIARRNWSGAVVDANLNGRGVDAIAQALREKSIPFVIVTGYARDGLSETLAGVPVLVKPFQPEALVAAVVGLCSDGG